MTGVALGLFTGLTIASTSLLAQPAAPVRDGPRPWAGDWMVSGRVVVSSMALFGGQAQIQPVVEAFVTKNLSIGGFVSAGYIHLKKEAGGGGSSEEEWDGSSSSKSIGAGMLSLGPILTAYFTTGTVRPLLGLALGYVHDFIKDVPDMDGVLLFPHAGVLIALRERVTFSLAVGYSFTFRRQSWRRTELDIHTQSWSWRRRDVDIYTHTIPFAMGVGYVF